MIVDTLEKKNKMMKDLHRLELIQTNRQQQVVADTHYTALVGRTHVLTKCLYYAQKKLAFKVPEQIINSITELLLALRDEVASDFANEETTADLSQKYREIQELVIKEWKKHYAELVGATRSTLRAIHGVNAEKVEMCQAKIDAVSTWKSDETLLHQLRKALDEAEQLIQELDLDPEIVTFLEDMNSGCATVENLNTTVLAWIQKESLQRKIKLSFSAR